MVQGRERPSLEYEGRSWFLGSPVHVGLALHLNGHSEAAVLNGDIAGLSGERDLSAVNFTDERDGPGTHFIVNAAHILPKQAD